ncbi:beta-ketoacyl synthase N-terminal-like domain-containing protein [Tumebacillus flagellatus]|uniref:Uncharacterized protein n=1 Tax=Tumebacillus flagellatus TaxID=1157490 RepID=A0A074LM45_9BACL|nr:type I polyketide synthase [Tumebacillus flagellatus]KEO83161.1 hypothetical protein EL26_11880 [Tumebacillus flagellatus]
MEQLLRLLLESATAGKMDRDAAVQAIQLLREQEQNARPDDIAIIGLAADLPGAESADVFYENLRAGLDAVRSFPDERRADIDRYLRFLGTPEEELRYTDGAYLPHIDEFDPAFFRLSPKEASLMDPNQRLFLQTAFHALEDAGYGGGQLAGSSTGVYVGFSNNVKDSYQKMILDADPESVPQSIAGNLSSILPTRLSYLLNLKGPTLVVDTACSASLVALHLACQGIRNGDCETALVGSVKLHTVPLASGNFKLGMESSDERTRAFSDGSDGTGIGEGSIAVFLKPLRAAQRDRDHVYGVIKGSAINQDGASMSITAPNPAAQTDVLVKAWEAAGIHPETLSYLEAHGTGTELGDPMEINALKRAFARYTDAVQFCGIGSVKPNIGHLYEAAGLASVVKGLLMFKHRELLPSLHVNRPNRQIDFMDSPFYLNTKLRPWETAPGVVRRMGISSFGFSGTNCHVVLEEPPVEAVTERGVFSEGAYVLPISAKTTAALRQLWTAYRLLLEKNELPLHSLCYTAQTGRGHYEHRVALVFRNRDELRELLAQEAEAGRVFGEGDENANRLAAAYVEGADVRWRDFYVEIPAKVSLPLYPFARQRCWVQIPDAAEGEFRSTRARASERATSGQVADVLLNSGSGHVPTEMELLVARIWSEALGIAEFDVRDNYYELGGDSVMGIRIIQRVNELTGLQLPAREYLNHLTIESFARYLESLRKEVS